MKEDSEFAELAPWLVLVIALLSGALRALLLAGKGLWLDETFSVWLANHSVGDVLYWTARIDQQPPLYYLLLHYWTAANGAAPYYARLLSVLFSAAAIPVIYLIGKRMAGVMVGFAAAVLLALSPFHVRFAQEARMYSLLTFNAAVATYALVRLLSDPRPARPIGSQFRDALQAWRTAGPVQTEGEKFFNYTPDLTRQPRWRAWLMRHHLPSLRAVAADLTWVAFIVFTAATMLTHHTAILFFVAANVFVLGLLLYRRMSKHPEQALARKHPEQALARKHPERSATESKDPSPPAQDAFGPFQPPSLANWLKAQAAILLLWGLWLPAFIRQAAAVDSDFWLPAPTWESVGQALKSFLNAPAPGAAAAGNIALIWVLYAVVLGLGLLYFRRKLSQLLFLAAMIAVPILGELLVSLRRPVFYDRTLIWVTIPLFLLLAAGLAQLKFRPLVFLGLVVLGALNLFAVGDYFKFMPGETWGDAAGYVSLFGEPGDLVVFAGPRGQVPFDYYFKTYEDRYGAQVEKRGAPVDLLDAGNVEPRMTERDVPRLESLLSGRQRAWLIYSGSEWADPAGLVPKTFASKMKLTRQRDFYGGQVQLYEAPLTAP